MFRRTLDRQPVKQFLGKCIAAITLLASSYMVEAATAIQIIPAYNPSTYDKAITQLYKAPAMHAKNLEARLNFASAYFIGKPYQLFPLGEGPTAQFDQSPLYRTDVFDCMT